jgi:hypothetical protein
MNDQLAQHYLEDALHTFRDYKRTAERAFAQTSETDFFRIIDSESNSIAVIVKHVGGNLRSRYTDFLTTDGEKPDRNRDGEFEMETPLSREEILGWWNEGWAIAMQAIHSLTARGYSQSATSNHHRVALNFQPGFFFCISAERFASKASSPSQPETCCRWCIRRELAGFRKRSQRTKPKPMPLPARATRSPWSPTDPRCSALATLARKPHYP